MEELEEKEEEEELEFDNDGDIDDVENGDFEDDLPADKRITTGDLHTLAEDLMEEAIAEFASDPKGPEWFQSWLERNTPCSQSDASQDTTTQTGGSTFTFRSMLTASAKTRAVTRRIQRARAQLAEFTGGKRPFISDEESRRLFDGDKPSQLPVQLSAHGSPIHDDLDELRPIRTDADVESRFLELQKRITEAATGGKSSKSTDRSPVLRLDLRTDLDPQFSKSIKDRTEIEGRSSTWKPSEQTIQGLAELNALLSNGDDGKLDAGDSKFEIPLFVKAVEAAVNRVIDKAYNQEGDKFIPTIVEHSKEDIVIRSEDLTTPLVGDDTTFDDQALGPTLMDAMDEMLDMTDEETEETEETEEETDQEEEIEETEETEDDKEEDIRTLDELELESLQKEQEEVEASKNEIEEIIIAADWRTQPRTKIVWGDKIPEQWVRPDSESVLADLSRPKLKNPWALSVEKTQRTAKFVSFHSREGGTGKTLVAVQAARLLAAAGCKVLLIEADLRSPRIGHLYPQAPTKASRSSRKGKEGKDDPSGLPSSSSNNSEVPELDVLDRLLAEEAEQIREISDDAMDAERVLRRLQSVLTRPKPITPAFNMWLKPSYGADSTIVRELMERVQQDAIAERDDMEPGTISVIYASDLPQVHELYSIEGVDPMDAGLASGRMFAYAKLDLLRKANFIDADYVVIDTPSGLSFFSAWLYSISDTRFVVTSPRSNAICIDHHASAEFSEWVNYIPTLFPKTARTYAILSMYDPSPEWSRVQTPDIPDNEEEDKMTWGRDEDYEIESQATAAKPIYKEISRQTRRAVGRTILRKIEANLEDMGLPLAGSIYVDDVLARILSSARLPIRLLPSQLPRSVLDILVYSDLVEATQAETLLRSVRFELRNT